jgi:uncharacterized protein
VNSALYETTVAHLRTFPRRHAFSNRLFSFAFDIDEIDAIAARIPWFSRNRRNVYAFFDDDHVSFGRATLRENTAEILRRAGIVETAGRITLITNVRIAGYVFNPVSFFFIEDATGAPLAAIAEVNNTFGETKTYVMPRDTYRNGQFEMRVPKEFYISPFLANDAELHLRLSVPGDVAAFTIDTYERGRRVLHATMRGKRRELTAARLAWFTVRYPLMTVGVIAAIHWQALRLFLKRIHFYPKSERPDLQTGIHGRAGDNVVPFKSRDERKHA